MAVDPKAADSNSDAEPHKTSQKRKVSPTTSEQNGERREDVSPKRIRLDENGATNEGASPSAVDEPRQVSPHPGDKPDGEPDNGQDDKSESTLDEKPDEKSSERPGSISADKPNDKRDDNPATAAATEEDAAGNALDHPREPHTSRQAQSKSASREELQYDDPPAKPVTEAPRQAAAPDADRRRKFNQEERKRGQRLFGGLMSTLSQTTASSQQKKRLEIERRQQEKAQQQRVEYDKRRSEKLAKLKDIRKTEQIKFDEQVVGLSFPY